MFHGVMVALEFLVLSVIVRIGVEQLPLPPEPCAFLFFPALRRALLFQAVSFRHSFFQFAHVGKTKIGDKQPTISVYLLLDWLSIQPHCTVSNVLVLLVRIETRARLRSIVPMTRYSLYVVSAAQMFE